MLSQPLHRLTDRVLRALRPKAEPQQPVVLCVDDDPDVRALCTVTLERAGFTVESATDGRDALDKMADGRYSAVLLDLSMPHVHGTTVLGVLRKRQPELVRRLIVISAAPAAALAELHGVSAILRKPFPLGELVEAVRDCCEGEATLVL